MLSHTQKRTLKQILASCAMLAAASSAFAQGAQTWVSPTPGFYPTGSNVNPFGTLNGAICVTDTAGTVSLQPGRINESITINRSVTLTAPNGPATIDARSTSSTTLRVGSYNVRLWPGFFVSLTLAEAQRAPLIGNRIDIENCDIIGIQELWDYGLDIPNVDGYLSDLGVGYNFYYYGSDFAGNGVNSGLVTYSNHAALGVFQGAFVECDGNDCSSNKGWTRYTFNKAGFSVIVYNTHTQAGNSSENVQTRIAQLNQIAIDASIQRAFNQGAVTFVVGDFNVDSWNSEFANVRAAFSGSGFVDTRGQLPCSPGFSDCTACSTNTIKQIFGNDGTNTILDHILYAPSLDGTVDIIPTNYEVKTYKRTDGGEWCRTVTPTGCANDLSDHEAIFGNFELRRVTP